MSTSERQLQDLRITVRAMSLETDASPASSPCSESVDQQHGHGVRDISGPHSQGSVSNEESGLGSWESNSADSEVIGELASNVQKQIQQKLDAVPERLPDNVPAVSPGIGVVTMVTENWEDQLKAYKHQMPENLKNGYFDVAILYCEQNRPEVMEYKKHLEEEVTYPHHRKVKVILYDGEELQSLAGSKLKSIEVCMNRCTYMFVYVTKEFCSDTWMELSSESCLMEAIENPIKRWCVVPVYTSQRNKAGYRIPMGINSLKGVSYYNNDEFYRNAVSKLLSDKFYVRDQHMKDHEIKQMEWLHQFKLEEKERQSLERQMAFRQQFEQQKYEELYRRREEADKINFLRCHSQQPVCHFVTDPLSHSRSSPVLMEERAISLPQNFSTGDLKGQSHVLPPHIYQGHFDNPYSQETKDQPASSQRPNIASCRAATAAPSGGDIMRHPQPHVYQGQFDNPYSQVTKDQPASLQGPNIASCRAATAAPSGGDIMRHPSERLNPSDLNSPEFQSVPSQGPKSHVSMQQLHDGKSLSSVPHESMENPTYLMGREQSLLNNSSVLDQRSGTIHAGNTASGDTPNFSLLSVNSLAEQRLYTEAMANNYPPRSMDSHRSYSSEFTGSASVISGPAGNVPILSAFERSGEVIRQQIQADREQVNRTATHEDQFEEGGQIVPSNLHDAFPESEFTTRDGQQGQPGSSNLPVLSVFGEDGGSLRQEVQADQRQRSNMFYLAQTSLDKDCRSSSQYSAVGHQMVAEDNATSQPSEADRLERGRLEEVPVQPRVIIKEVHHHYHPAEPEQKIINIYGAHNVQVGENSKIIEGPAESDSEDDDSEDGIIALKKPVEENETSETKSDKKTTESSDWVDAPIHTSRSIPEQDAGFTTAQTPFSKESEETYCKTQQAEPCPPGGGPVVTREVKPRKVATVAPLTPLTEAKDMKSEADSTNLKQVFRSPSPTVDETQLKRLHQSESDERNVHKSVFFDQDQTAVKQVFPHSDVSEPADIHSGGVKGTVSSYSSDETLSKYVYPDTENTRLKSVCPVRSSPDNSQSVVNKSPDRTKLLDSVTASSESRTVQLQRQREEKLSFSTNTAVYSKEGTPVDVYPIPRTSTSSRQPIEHPLEDEGFEILNVEYPLNINRRDASGQDHDDLETDGPGPGPMTTSGQTYFSQSSSSPSLSSMTDSNHWDPAVFHPVPQRQTSTASSNRGRGRRRFENCPIS